MKRIAVAVSACVLLAPPAWAQGPQHGVDAAAFQQASHEVQVQRALEHSSAGTVRRTLLFALGGAVLGAAVCTVISNLSDDHDGFSTCTAKGYLLLAGGGAAAGAAAALLTDGDQ